MLRTLLLLSALAALLPAQPTATSAFLPATADTMQGRLGQDRLGRTYVLQHNKIVRLTPGQPGFQEFTYLPSPTLLTPQEIKVDAEGFVYVAGVHALSATLGPSQCDRLPLPTSVLGGGLHGDVATHWLLKLDLRALNPNPAPVRSICALARGFATSTGHFKLNAEGTRLYWYGIADAETSFSYTRNFGVQPAPRHAWIVELDDSFLALQTVRLAPVNTLETLAAGNGRVAVFGSTAGFLLPQAGPLFAPSASEPQFVTVFNADFSALLLSTRLGGSATDTITDGEFDAANNLYFAGRTQSLNLPVVNAHQPALGGLFDLMLGRLASSLDHLDYLTYYGGTGNEFGQFSWNRATGDVHLTAAITSATPVLSPMSGSPSQAAVAHFTNTGRLDYFSPLPTTLNLRIAMSVLDTTGGGVLTGYGITGPNDVLIEFQDPVADLALVSSATVAVSNGFETDFKVNNLSHVRATGVRLTARLPLGFNAYLNATPKQGTCTLAATVLTCDFGTIEPGPLPDVRVRLRTRLASPGNVSVNAATSDPDTNNNHN